MIILVLTWSLRFDFNRALICACLSPWNLISCYLKDTQRVEHLPKVTWDTLYFTFTHVIHTKLHFIGRSYSLYYTNSITCLLLHLYSHYIISNFVSTKEGKMYSVFLFCPKSLYIQKSGTVLKLGGTQDKL